MLFAVILLCSISVEPAFCDERSAIKYEHLSNGSDTPMGCFHNAAIWAAKHDFVTVANEQYILIHCTSHSQGTPV